MKRLNYQTPADLRALHKDAQTADNAAISQTVREILLTVQKNGDDALRQYSQKFDGVVLADLLVPASVIQAAYQQVDPAVVASLQAAADNIFWFHEKQGLQSFEATRPEGTFGIKITPLERVGIYVPGGTAAYPSSVLMNAIPAKVAGVSEIIMVTPPQKEGINPAVLVAADIAGVDQIYTIGGAQAVAALTFGTQTVPKVDKITGPGNAYVAEAKRQVYGFVDIDMIAGPSEIGIIADETAEPAEIAADLLSQAEHDVRARTFLVTTDADLLAAVSAELDTQLATLPRAEIARQSLTDFSYQILVQTDAQLYEVMNAIAPEHLEIQLAEPLAALDKIRHAGSIFLGRYASEPVGDYFAGPNHILPTSGTARFSSPLNVTDFQKMSQYLYYEPAALAQNQSAITTLARTEGLEAHARAIEARFPKKEQS